VIYDNKMAMSMSDQLFLNFALKPTILFFWPVCCSSDGS